MRNRTLFLTIVFILTTVFAGQVFASQARLTTEKKAIIGTWRLKKSSLQKIIPAVFTPESLVLAADSDFAEITINEGFKEFIQTQTIATDGKRVVKNIFNIGKVSSRAFWKGGMLVVETVTERGDEIVESYELSASQKRLLVSVQLKRKGSTRFVKSRRVFDRVAETDGDSTAQVGIAAFPF